MMVAIGTNCMFWFAVTLPLTLLSGIGLGIAIADHWPQKDQSG